MTMWIKVLEAVLAASSQLRSRNLLNPGRRAAAMLSLWMLIGKAEHMGVKSWSKASLSSSVRGRRSGSGKANRGSLRPSAGGLVRWIERLRVL